MHRERLAILMSVLLLLSYHEGNRFTFHTDHDSLTYIIKFSSSTSRLPKLRIRLSENNFDVLHQAEVRYQAAGALPRLLTTGTDISNSRDDISHLAVLVNNDGTPIVQFIETHAHFDQRDKMTPVVSSPHQKNENDSKPSYIQDIKREQTNSPCTLFTKQPYALLNKQTQNRTSTDTDCWSATHLSTAPLNP